MDNYYLNSGPHSSFESFQMLYIDKKELINFYEINLKQKINKPKELWKTLKSMGFPSKTVSPSNTCLKDRNEIVFNNTKNCSIFKMLLFQFCARVGI